MTQLSNKDHAAQMADMKTFDEQMPFHVFVFDEYKDFGYGGREDMSESF